MTNFDNNEDKICSPLKDDVGGSRIKLRARSRIRSNDYRSCDHGVIIAFLFGVSCDKQVIVKSYLQLGEKTFKPYKRKARKTSAFLM